MQRYRLIAAFTMVTGLVTSSPVCAQFERIDNRIEPITNAFESRFGAPVSPFLIRSLKPQEIEFSLLEPLKWEARKIDIQIDLLEQLRSRQQEKIEQAEQRLAETNSLLFQSSVAQREDIGNLLAEQRDAERELAMIAAEINAMRTAMGTEQEKHLAELKQQQTELAIEGQKKRLEMAQRNLQRVEQVAKQGLVPQEQIDQQRAELEETLERLRFLEIDLEKAMIETDPEWSAKLAATISREQELARRLEDRRLTPDRFQELEQAVLTKNEVVNRINGLRESDSQFENQLDLLGMEKEYLEAIIRQYQNALRQADEEKQPAAEKSDEEKSDEE